MVQTFVTLRHTRRSTGLLISWLCVVSLVGCDVETPADSFVRFVSACSAHDADNAFGRLSPPTQQLVTLSSARHAAAHPERRMAPAQFMFAEESIAGLAQGFSQVNEVARLTVQGESWAVLHEVNLEGDFAQVFMVQSGTRWLLHAAMPPAELLKASHSALEGGDH